MLQLKEILRKNFLPVYFLIIFVFNIVLLYFPLTNTFGYEFSVLNSILLVFLSGIFCIRLLRKKQTLLKSSPKEILKILIVSFCFFLIISAVVSVTNSVFNNLCSLKEGFLFFIVITIPSAVIGASLGFLSFFLFKKLRVIGFILIFIIVLLIPLFEFYFNPQIYFYNPVFAFLPGTIYDEGLSVDFNLILYRIFNIFYFTGILILLWKWFCGKVKISRKVLFTIIIIVPIVFLYFSPSLNFSTTLNRIKSELKGRIETSHFIIYYPKKVDENLIKNIAVHHEYYYQELSRFFDLNPPKKITSFLFLNAEQKGRLFGSKNADVAKPWLYQIFTIYDNYQSTLKHEIAHVFTASFGSGLFKAADKFNPSLIEGAAVAADPIYDENNIDYMAALAFHNGYKININNLYSFSSFFTNVSSISYVYAGAFSKFLIEKYGIEKFKHLYQDLDFKKIYKTGIDSLSKEFYLSLKLIDNKRKIAEANYYFGRVSIFYKVCPRYAANQLRKGWEYFYEKKYQESKNIFKELLNVTNNYSAVIGLAKSYSELKEFNLAIDLLKENLDNFENSAYYYGTELTLGDILSENGDLSEADSFYQDIINKNPNRTYYYISQVRKSLLKKDTLTAQYLKSDESGKYLILKELNLNRYNFYTFPVLIDLSRSINEKYNMFINQFDKTIYINDYAGSYAMYKLSNYMLENLDFQNARKMAALSLRYEADKNFNYILQNNYNKMNWFYYNAQKILNHLKIN